MRISAIYISPGHNFFGHHGKPAGKHDTTSVKEVECVPGRGLRGDRFWDYKRDYAGQVTFFDEAVHRALLRELRPGARSPAGYRRNIVTRGADLPALIGQEFTVQNVRFLGIAECKPCYWMEQAVGAGAENFLKGRGGLRAKILTEGTLGLDCATEGALLLAGGRSRRMGRDKASLDWRGQTLAEHQADTLKATGAWPLFISCRKDQTWVPAGFERIEDRAEDAGVLGALVTAWATVPVDVLTVLAVDLPLVDFSFLERLAGIAREEGVSIVPFHDGRFEPLAAAWHRSAVPALGEVLAAEHSLQAACAALRESGHLKTYELTPGEVRQLTNVNTPDDLKNLSGEAALHLA